jgi:hypothetical protein
MEPAGVPQRFIGEALSNPCVDVEKSVFTNLARIERQAK